MRRLCVSVSLLLLVGSCVCMFPRPCANSEGLRTKECCPLGKDGSVCGVKSGRGKCSDERWPDEPHGGAYPFLFKDDRENWPLEFFNRTCSCDENYSGFDCGECIFGYSGHDCSVYRDRVRRNVLNLTLTEKRKLVEYFDQAKNTVNPDYVIATATRDAMGPNGENPKFSNVTTLDLFAWIHYYVTHPTFLGGKKKPFTDINFAHGATAFPVWHRIYLLQFENEIQKMTNDPDFAIPYWDWRGKKECDVCTDDLMGGQDPTDPNLISPGSPFSKWKAICTQGLEYHKQQKLCNGTREGPLLRNPGNNDNYTTLPTEAEVKSLMRFNAYEKRPYNRSAEKSFRNMLEGFTDPETGLVAKRTRMHNAVHMYMNGTMSHVPAAANDPIFYLHHSFVDSLFSQWMKHRKRLLNYPLAYAPIGHNFELHMVPFLPTHTNGRYIHSMYLGYEYAYLQGRGDDRALSDPVLSDWAEWSNCRPFYNRIISSNSFRCNRPTTGHQHRMRRCLHKAEDGRSCRNQDLFEVRLCINIQDCYISGTWLDNWSQWSKCRPSCGSSYSKRFRERICQLPDYSNHRAWGAIGRHIGHGKTTQSSRKIALHGHANVDCGELPAGKNKNETQACPYYACVSLLSNRFD